MTLPEPIRIISDIHLGHPASFVDDPSQLAPLCEDAGTVVFNGDSVEMRFASQQETAHRDLAELRKMCAEAGAESVFINGNHDPLASEINHLDLCDGAVLVTHGDFLFHDISPWNPKAHVIGAAHTRELDRLDDEALQDFEERLSAGKRAALALHLADISLGSGRLARIATIAAELWPPWRPFQIMKVWWDTPARAVAIAETFRPRAKFVIIGHVHLGGASSRRSRFVINTGSFLPFSGRYVAEIEGTIMRVRHILRRGGKFVPGGDASRFDLKAGRRI